MDKQEFGQLVTALRKRYFNLSTGGGLTQRGLAEQANLSYKTVTNIEQGRKACLDADTLIRLAGALRLTTLERQEFFALAAAVASADVVRKIQEPEKLLEQVLRMLRAAKVPTIVYDAFYHVVAVNGSALALHAITGSQPDSIPLQNNIHFLCCALEAQSPLRRDLYTIWDQFLRLNVHQFRVMTLRYRHTAYFQKLFDELLRYDEFYSTWVATQLEEFDYWTQLRRYQYRHPHYGALDYATTTEQVWTSVGKLYVSLLSPLDDHTWATFDDVMKQNCQIVARLTPWPHPSLVAIHRAEARSSIQKS